MVLNERCPMCIASVMDNANKEPLVIYVSMKVLNKLKATVNMAIHLVVGWKKGRLARLEVPVWLRGFG